MKRRLALAHKTLALIPLLLSLSLMLMIACGEAAPSAPEPQTGGMAAGATSAPGAGESTAASQAGGGAKPTPTLFIEVIKREPTPTLRPGVVPTAVPTAMPVTSDIKYGGHVPMHTYSAPVTARPLPEATYSHMIALAPLYNQIVEYNPETADPTDIRCDLCTQWDMSDDGLTYTYHLHEEGRWSDGVPITSADMIFSIDAIVDPDDPQFGDIWKGHKTRSRSGLWKPYYESSKALDDYTFEVTLKYPSAAFHPALAMEPAKMMPKH